MEGNWLGGWQGQWFGSGEPAPAGSLAGSASLSVSASGTARALGNLSGTASVALSASGSATGVGGTANVKVSWFQFNTEAVPYETKVNWLQFDTQAAQSNVKVNWLQFDTQAGTGKGDGRSGYWRLFYQQLQEEELAKIAKNATPEPAPEPQEKVVELADGSAEVIPLRKPEPRVVKPKPVSKPTRRLKVVNTSGEPYILETMRLSMEVSRLFTSWQIPLIITQAQDVEDEELLLLLAA